MRLGRTLLLITMVGACASAAAALASAPYAPQIRYVPDDQRLARSIVLKNADLREVGAAWKGGSTKPSVEGDPCLRARQSDLVLTGAAQSELSNNHGSVTTTVWVLKAPQMVLLDVSRQPPFAVAARCARAEFASYKNVKVRSVTKLPFPTYGVRTDAMRVAYDATTSGRAVRQIEDSITVFLGRFEINLWFAAHAKDKAAAGTIERELVKLLVQRATR